MTRTAIFAQLLFHLFLQAMFLLYWCEKKKEKETHILIGAHCAESTCVRRSRAKLAKKEFRAWVGTQKKTPTSTENPESSVRERKKIEFGVTFLQFPRKNASKKIDENFAPPQP